LGLLKTNFSTGWDCPRAEVMMSFRRAEDHTYIAQLLGRMVRTPLARRIERDAALNDVHLFLPYFDDAAVKAVVDDLKDVEHAPPAVVGSSRELVTLNRRADAADIFAAMTGLVTYRANAARAQSHLRRFVGLARRLNLDDIEPAAWGAVRGQVVAWLGTALDGLKAAGTFAKSAAAIMRVGMRTTTLDTGSELVTPVRECEIEASEADLDRQFAEAGQRLSNGLHQTYWDAHGDRDALDVKVEVILLARSHAVMAGLEAKAETAFDSLYDRHKHAIGKLKEKEGVRQGDAGADSAVGGYRFDILEPHDPSLADNFEKAVGLARFAERHGHLFHRIQLIRKQPSKAGGECYVRLELNSEVVRKQVSLVTSNPQLDALFSQYVL
jgi:type III restriction enzyme